MAQLLETYSQMANQCGRFERALRLAAAAAALREEFNARSSPDDQAKLNQTLDSIREDLGETASKAAWAEGRSTATEKAIQYALTTDTF